MRNKITIFFCITFLLLSIVPAINVASGHRTLKIKNLYSIDFIIPYISRFLYGYGISLFPGQVVVGKDDWLFLGDSYANTLTITRLNIDSSYVKDAIQKDISLQGWESFFTEQGVRSFKVLVGPNKSSVYPEFLPGWAAPAEQKNINYLMDKSSHNYFVYPRDVLLLAKNNYADNNMYYKADTHWNNLGAWVGFDAFVKRIKESDPSIHYDQHIHVKGNSQINGDDLASFLRLLGEIKDKQPQLEVLPIREVHTVCTKFYTQEHYACDRPEIISQPEPLLVATEGAENTKRVLWLRDSFGTAMSPYMARLFSNVVQVHYDNVSKDSLIKLVKDFKPDYVFMTIVERDLDKGLPAAYPQFHSYLGQFVQHNDVTNTDDGFSVIGDDPYFVYELDSPVQGKQNDFITMQLLCDSKDSVDGLVDLQVFWKKNTDEFFSEDKSGRFSVPLGAVELDLGSVLNWRIAQDIDYLRLDIEPASIANCSSFVVRNFAFNEFK